VRLLNNMQYAGRKSQLSGVTPCCRVLQQIAQLFQCINLYLPLAGARYITLPSLFCGF